MAMDGRVAITVIVIRVAELACYFEMVWSDVHVIERLVLCDEVDVDAEAGQGRVAISRWQLAHDLVVGPIFFCDIDDVFDGTFSDVLYQWQGVVAVVGEGGGGERVCDGLLRVGCE